MSIKKRSPWHSNRTFSFNRSSLVDFDESRILEVANVAPGETCEIRININLMSQMSPNVQTIMK
jgi:hypothetical protein